MLPLPTGCAAVAAAAAPAADSVAGGNGTSCNPIPEHSFMVFVNMMLSTFQQIMMTRWTLAHHNVLGALGEPVLVGEQADRRNRIRLLES